MLFFFLVNYNNLITRLEYPCPGILKKLRGDERHDLCSTGHGRFKLNVSQHIPY